MSGRQKPTLEEQRRKASDGVLGIAKRIDAGHQQPAEASGPFAILEAAVYESSDELDLERGGMSTWEARRSWR